MISQQSLEFSRVCDFLRYAGEHGMFFIFNPKTRRVGAADTCREVIGWHFKRNTSFLGFVRPDLNINSLNTFWEKIEKKLKLDIPTVLYPVANEPNMVILELSPFWLENSTRRGFCTLFLRCGAVYFEDKLLHAILDYDLAHRIKDVIYWFLEGNTVPTYKRLRKGVSDYFSQDREEDYMNIYGEVVYTKPRDYKKLLVPAKRIT